MVSVFAADGRTEMDLEAAAWARSACAAVVVSRLSNQTASVSVPVHIRYQRPGSDRSTNLVTVEAVSSPPLVVVPCSDGDGNVRLIAIQSGTPEGGGDVPPLVASVPALNPSLAPIITAVTFLSTTLCCAALLYAVLRRR
jgi:hypothetical protein